MRIDRLITLVVVVVLLGALAAASGRPSRPTTPPDKTAQAESANDFWPSPSDLTLAVVVRVAWLAFWVVVAWRAMRALESIASSLRRRPTADGRGSNDAEGGRAG